MDSTVDPGLGGFFNAVGDTPADTAPDPSDASPQVEPTAASPDAPEETSTEDLTAEEVVAARLAARLDKQGIEIPTPEESAEAIPVDDGTHPLLSEATGEPSLDELTPEQLRALAEEAIRLRGEVTTASQQEGLRKVRLAEANAIAQVQAAYEQNVLAVSDAHYSAVFNQRLTALVGEVTEAELPARVDALRRQVNAAQKAWEDEQYDAHEAQAKQAALNARLAAPEFRQYAAEQLVKQAGLPTEAVAEVLKVRDTRDFEDEVKKLVGIRDALLAERAKHQANLRAEGNKRLRETTPRTAATGRPPGGKPPAYKGNIAEGVAIVSTMRR